MENNSDSEQSDTSMATQTSEKSVLENPATENSRAGNSMKNPTVDISIQTPEGLDPLQRFTRVMVAEVHNFADEIFLQGEDLGVTTRNMIEMIRRYMESYFEWKIENEMEIVREIREPEIDISDTITREDGDAQEDDIITLE